MPILLFPIHQHLITTKRHLQSKKQKGEVEADRTVVIVLWVFVMAVAFAMILPLALATITLIWTENTFFTLLCENKKNREASVSLVSLPVFWFFFFFIIWTLSPPHLFSIFCPLYSLLWLMVVCIRWTFMTLWWAVSVWCCHGEHSTIIFLPVNHTRKRTRAQAAWSSHISLLQLRVTVGADRNLK